MNTCTSTKEQALDIPSTLDFMQVFEAANPQGSFFLLVPAGLRFLIPLDSCLPFPMPERVNTPTMPYVLPVCPRLKTITLTSTLPFPSHYTHPQVVVPPCRPPPSPHPALRKGERREGTQKGGRPFNTCQKNSRTRPVSIARVKQRTSQQGHAAHPMFPQLHVRDRPHPSQSLLKRGVAVAPQSLGESRNQRRYHRWATSFMSSDANPKDGISNVKTRGA